LAKLTDGRLVQLELVDRGRGVRVCRSDGANLGLETLSPAERDQVYLSFSLALAGAIAHRGMSFPLLLDEPFLRLDPQGTAALAAVLDDLGRCGQQIVVFTGQREAADRLASLGAPVCDIGILRLRKHDLPVAAVNSAPAAPTSIRTVITKKTKSVRRAAENGKRRKVRPSGAKSDSSSSTDRSDAA
jgi:hypothetical protein